MQLKIKHRIYCHYCHKSLFWNFFLILFDTYKDNPFKTQKGRRCPFCNEMNRVPVNFRRDCYLISVVIFLASFALAVKFRGDSDAVLSIICGGILLFCLAGIFMLASKVKLEPVLLDVDESGKIDFSEAETGDLGSASQRYFVSPGIFSMAGEKESQGIVRPLWAMFCSFYIILSAGIITGYFFTGISMGNILPQIFFRLTLAVACYLYSRGLVFINPRIQKHRSFIILLAFIFMLHDWVVMFSLSAHQELLLPFASLLGLHALGKIVPKLIVGNDPVDDRLLFAGRR